MTGLPKRLNRTLSRIYDWTLWYRDSKLARLYQRAYLRIINWHCRSLVVEDIQRGHCSYADGIAALRMMR